MNTITRRQFQLRSALGLGGVGLGTLLASHADGQICHHAPSAKSVIMLFMAGGPSQVDTFDPKPDLAELSGKDVPESIAKLVPPIKRAGLKNVMPSHWEFSQHGKSGLSISSLLPHTAAHADKLCVIRSMSHRNPVHGPGECVALTGSGGGDRPSLGAWSLFGLGPMSRQLPAFIAMNLHSDGMQYPQAAGWGPGFLPSRFQGTVVDPVRGIRDVALPKGVSQEQRDAELAAIKQLNRQFLDRIQRHTELEARLRSYQMASSLQTAAPELFDIQNEGETTQQLYGMDDKSAATVGRGCLLARRMVERGVRFIQVRVGGWDAHGNIKGNHERMASRTDKPIAGLLADLEQRGLLDSTLVVWAGEFGRTPTMEGRGNGRDHSPLAYSVWLAGGGIRGGQVIGETDPIGYTVTQRPVKPLDLHATILHALGIDSTRLVYDHHGLKETPLGVTGGSAVLEAFG